MLDYAHMTLEQLIDPKGYDCECGRHHSVNIKYVKIGKGAIASLPEAMEALGAKKPFVVCDKNTWQVAGCRVEEILRANGYACTVYVVPEIEDRLRPGEWELGSMVMHYDPSCDLILGVGSGVVNDLSKVLARAVGCQSAIVGTAPSMDGYASDSASMEVNKVKTSIYCKVPAAMIMDIDIIAQAPMNLLQAGLGDMIAKYTALCEWRFAKLIIDEYYCEGIAELMREALRKVVDAAEKLAERDPDAVQSVVEGLIIAGIAMAYAGSSRPASGLEHYFSHMWEMMALEREEPYELHGIQVGCGTVLALRVLEKMRALKPTMEHAEAFLQSFDEKAWEENVRRIYGKTGEQIIKIEAKFRKNAPEGHRVRMTKIIENWDLICQIMDEELPETEKIVDLMRRIGEPVEAAEIGIGAQDVSDAFVGAREIRDKYLACSMLWDVGYNADIAQWLLESSK